MTKFELLIKRGYLVDPANGRAGRFDLGLAGGKVARVEPEVNPDKAEQVLDADGKLVLPGLIDSHVHVAPVSRAIGLRMLARAGVTTALECGGPVEDVIEGLARHGCGVNIAVLNKVDPGRSISGPRAGQEELTDYVDRSLSEGALGLKLLGGHHPLSPETTAAAIEAANRAGAYVAFHCGTTATGSNLHGLLEALELAGSNRLHVCHITAYCRGLTHGSPVKETMIALEELSQRPHLVSESHNGPYNGTGAQIENGLPRSHVTRTCLEAGGYRVGPAGLLDAAADGHLLVQKESGGEIIYLAPEAGVAHLKETDFKATVSFPVNRRSTAFLTATEKDNTGRFIVTALSTDGGGIPRNFLLSHGLSLVRFDALSLPEFVEKTAWAPARMLGLPGKGHLGEGADADIVIADPVSHEAVTTIAEGRVIMIGGLITGTGGKIITTERGLEALQAKNVPALATDLGGSLFYNAP